MYKEQHIFGPTYARCVKQSLAGLCAMLNTSTLSLDQTHNEKIDVVIFFSFFSESEKENVL